MNKSEWLAYISLCEHLFITYHSLGTLTITHTILENGTTECKLVQWLWRTVLEVPYETRHRVIIWCCNTIPGHIYRKNHNLKSYTHSNVHWSTDDSNQDTETILTEGRIRTMWFIHTMEHCCCCWGGSVMSRDAAHPAPRPWDSPGKSTGVGCHFLLQCMKGKWKWSCSVVLTLSDPMDCSPPGSSIHGIFQARVLEWGAIAFFHNGIRLKHKKRTKQCHLHQHGCI